MASSAPLLPKSSSNNRTASDTSITITTTTTTSLCGPHKPLAVLSGHAGSVSCLALCGEFLLSASRGRDIIVWQQPDLRQLARFGYANSDSSTSGSGFVKSLVAVGSRVFSAHQDSRIRVWKLSSDPENPFKLSATLPTLKDYFGRCINFKKQSNFVRTRRNHRKLWIEHADTISCLAVQSGLIYSGSWDKTLKVWRMSDLRCLESIKAHDDAVNALVAHKGLLYSASADGKIKVWGPNSDSSAHCLKGVLQCHKDVCWNAAIVCGNGRLVYGGGSDGRVMGWEMVDEKGEEWRPACDVRAHDASVLCLCSTGAVAEEFVCSGSADKSIAVWRREEEGGLCRVTVIRGHEAPVKCLQASVAGGIGEGFMLYSGGLDQRLRVWWVPKKYEEKEGEEGMKKCVLLR